MPAKMLFRTVPLAVALGLSSAATVISAPVSQAEVVNAAMQVTKAGTFEKTVSMSAFDMTVGMKSYEVKTSSMTHVTSGGKSIKLSALKKGDHITVKGELEMSSIMATSVAVGM